MWLVPGGERCQDSADAHGFVDGGGGIWQAARFDGLDVAVYVLAQPFMTEIAREISSTRALLSEDRTKGLARRAGWKASNSFPSATSD